MGIERFRAGGFGPGFYQASEARFSAKLPAHSPINQQPDQPTIPFSKVNLPPGGRITFGFNNDPNIQHIIEAKAGTLVEFYPDGTFNLPSPDAVVMFGERPISYPPGTPYNLVVHVPDCQESAMQFYHKYGQVTFIAQDKHTEGVRVEVDTDHSHKGRGNRHAALHLSKGDACELKAYHPPQNTQEHAMSERAWDEVSFGDGPDVWVEALR